MVLPNTSEICVPVTVYLYIQWGINFLLLFKWSKLCCLLCIVVFLHIIPLNSRHKLQHILQPHSFCAAQDEGQGSYSTAGTHIFLSVFHTHSYSLLSLTSGTGICWMLLCMFSLWLHLILHAKRNNLHCIFSKELQTHLQSFPLPQGPDHFLVSVDLFSASGCLPLIVWLGTHRHFQIVGSWAISPPPD